MRGQPSRLTQGLDLDIDQVIRKLETDNPQLQLNPLNIYQAIQRSNSSLKRRKKQFLEASIERVLDFRRREARENGEHGDSEEEIEAETDRVHAVKDDRFLLNRQMVKMWQIDTAKPAQASTPATSDTPASEGARSVSKKRKLLDDADDAAAPNRGASKNTYRSDSGQATATAPTTAEDATEAVAVSAKKAKRRRFEVDVPGTPILGGMDSAMADFRMYANGILNRPHIWTPNQLRHSHGVLVRGPPGVGKRSHVRAVAAHSQRPLLRIRNCFSDPDKLDKNVADVIEEARSLAPCIVLIDRIHDYMPRPSGSGHGDSRSRCVDAFELMMEKISSHPPTAPEEHRHILVVATTNKAEEVDPRVIGLLPHVVSMPFPGPVAREDILRTLTREITLATDFDFARHAKYTHGYTGRDLEQVVHLAQHTICMRHVHRDEQAASSLVNESRTEIEPPAPLAGQVSLDPLTNDIMTTAIQTFVPQSRKDGFSTLPSTTWSQVGALEAVRKQLRWSIVEPIRNPARFEIYNAGTSAGVLLWGPPGCGKTFVAQAVANEAQASFILINGPELLNKYVGESERSVRELFDRARTAAPCIIFFDEMESLVPKRESTTNDAGTRVVNTLLAELDGVRKRKGVYVVGTTNRPDMIDPAMLRPGRLDKKLFIDLPTEDERVDILHAIFRTQMRDPAEPDTAHLESVARDPRCANFSGADLKGLYFSAVAQAVLREPHPERHLTDEDWEHALRGSRPSVDPKECQRYRDLALKMGA